jgi:hypothetical protein
MRRALVAVSVVIGWAVLSSAAPAPKPPMSVPQKLSQRVKFDGIDDAKVTLGEALEKLTKLYDVNFDINERAFEFENLKEVGKTEIATPNPIPAMKNARLDTVLRKMLSRIPVPSGAMYLVRGDHIEITTGTFQAQEIWGKYSGPHLPLVHVTLEKCPLADAVVELAEQADFNILVDNRAAEQAKTAVSARLLNTPLDSALRLLADMADLRAVHLDNVLYLTTKENAAALEARLQKETIPVNPLDDTNENPGQYAPRKGKGRNIVITPDGGM